METKLQSKVTVTTDNLDMLVIHPQKALADFAGFWENQRPQELTRGWAEMVNYDIPYEKLENQVREWAELTDEERRNHTLYQNAKAVIERKDAFLPEALAHLHSFFPPDCDLSVTVHLTAFNPASAFAYEDIIINMQAKNWNENTDNILNIMVHEIGHVGHSYCRRQWTEENATPELKHKILDNINSEGICTYIGYTAQEFVPAPDDKDYQQIDNPDRVQEAFKEVNEIIAQIGKLPDDEVRKMGWDIGVIGRSYYVVGTIMCKTIDEQLGRVSLIEAMTTGPQFWANRYNQLAKDELKLVF